MIAASTDIDGPAFAGEAWTRDAAAHRNASAFAAYDLDDVHGGVTPYSPGFGRKRFVIRGDGGLWWGTDLRRDPWRRADVRLERAGHGHLRLLAPGERRAAMLEVAASGGRDAVLRMSGKEGPRVDLVAGGERGLRFRVGGEGGPGCGVDPGGAFRNRVEKDRPGAPPAGTWSAGACIVNLADDRVYWCVRDGTPGRWRSTRLS